MPRPRIILGIDPGFARLGFGVIEVSGSRCSASGYGVIETRAGDEFCARLLALAKGLKKAIKKYQPDIIAIEELFFFKNAKTALKVGEARGVAVYISAQANVPVREFTPLQVKQAVACYGRAEKLQMQKMVKTLLGMKEIPRPDDAADALAVALCCANTRY